MPFVLSKQRKQQNFELGVETSGYGFQLAPGTVKIVLAVITTRQQGKT